MSGLEALGAIASIVQLVNLAHKVFQSYEKVFEIRATKHHIAKEIVKDVENLKALIQQRPDLIEAPDLVQLIMKFCCDLEQIQKKLDPPSLQKRRGLALRHHIRLWWKAGDIRSDLERIEKEIEGCHKRLVAGGVVQIKLDVHEMQQTINSLEKRMQDLVLALQKDPRRAEEIIGIPSMTVSQMQRALNHAKTGLADQSFPRPGKPFLIQKVELLTEALGNHAGKAFLPVKFSREDSEEGASTTKANSRLTSNVRRIVLKPPGEDEEDAVSETLRMIRALRDGSSRMTAAELGDSLRRLGYALGCLGWREQALTVTEWEVEIYRKLAQDRPSAFEAKLTVSLSYLSRCLRNLAREDEALVAIEEAVELSRKISKDNQAYQADLAMSLNILSGRLAAVGRSKDAWVAIVESLAIYRRLTKEHPEVFLPDLAMALNSLSNRLETQGSSWPALKAILESVQIRRKLAADNPPVYLADLALSLGNLSNRFADMEMNLKALEAIKGSLTIRRVLAAQRPEVFQEDLASSLNNLSVCLEACGHPDEALDAMQQAESLYRSLWRDLPSVFQADFSMSVYNLSRQLFISQGGEEAMNLAIESVQLRLDIARDHPMVFLPKLANSLNLLCDIVVHVLCSDFEAYSTIWFPPKYKYVEELIHQAVRTYRVLIRRQPALSLPELTTPLDLIDGDMVNNKRLRDTVSAAAKVERPLSPTSSHSDLDSSCEGSANGERSNQLTNKRRSSRSSVGSWHSERSRWS